MIFVWDENNNKPTDRYNSISSPKQSNKASLANILVFLRCCCFFGFIPKFSRRSSHSAEAQNKFHLAWVLPQPTKPTTNPFLRHYQYNTQRRKSGKIHGILARVYFGSFGKALTMRWKSICEIGLRAYSLLPPLLLLAGWMYQTS